MPADTLKTAIGTYPHTKALKEGAVQPEGYTLDHVEVSPIIGAFRRMIRNMEFDVSEMALSTYLCARAYGKPITAIPVFPVRSFQHGGAVYNTKSGIKSPSDLSGKRVGVRAYTVTGPAWARGILHDEYGVDLNSITWVIVDEEHVAEYQEPSNVEKAPAGKTLEEMLAAGEIDAAIGVGRIDSEDVKPLIPDAQNAGVAYFQKTGIYPINHTVVIKNEHLEADPSLAVKLFNAFKQSKAVQPEDEGRAKLQQQLGTDPFPYGLAANRKVVETMIRFNVDQKIIPNPVKVEDVFASNTLDLS